MAIADEVKVSDAVLYSFHPGTMGGPAIADILFGKVNPSGKTPVTFPRMSGQVPIYYAQHKTGRPANPTEMLIDEIPVEAGQTSVGCRSFYLDAGNSPLFPFGYGLSYTTFEYSNLSLTSDKLTAQDTLSISFTLKNTGNYDGTEVVQLYIQDKVGSVTRPVKELKHFEKQLIKAGETKTFRFDIDLERDFGFVNEDGKRFLEAGEYHILVQGQTVKIELID